MDYFLSSSMKNLSLVKYALERFFMFFKGSLCLSFRSPMLSLLVVTCHFSHDVHNTSDLIPKAVNKHCGRPVALSGWP